MAGPGGEAELMGDAQPPPCMAVLASAAGAGAAGPSRKEQLRSNSASDSGRLLQWQWGGWTARLGLGPLRMWSSWGMRKEALLGVRERKFGPEEGKKEKQVRRKQEVGTSRGLARGML